MPLNRHEVVIQPGRYELLEPKRRRREEKFTKFKNDAGLAINGTGVKLRRPKRGECPRGLDAEDDPRFSALALLADAGSASEGQGAATADAPSGADGEVVDDRGRAGESDVSSHED